jgi:hypothetical protein
MNIYRNAVMPRVVRKSYMQPLALMLGLLFAWHSMARADNYVPPAPAQLPDSVQGPGADRIPPSRSCTDAMDFLPEDNMPNPFDANRVAFRAAPARPPLRIATDAGCQDFSRKVDKI